MQTNRKNLSRNVRTSVTKSNARKRAALLAAAMFTLPCLGTASNVLATDLYPTLTSSSGSFNEGDTVDIWVDIVPTSGSWNSIDWNLYLGSSFTSGNGTPANLTGVVFDQDDNNASWSIEGSVYYESSGTEDFSDGQTFTINNVAPTITSATMNGIEYALVPAFVYEGDVVPLAMTTTDPGADDHTFFIDGNYAGTDSSQSGTRYSNTVYRPVDQNGSFNIEFSVNDDDEFTTINRTLDVYNTAPTIQSAMLNGNDDGSGLTVYEGDSVYASLTSTDPGADGHTFHVDVDYGPNLDGSFDANTSGTRMSGNIDVTQYQNGSYTINFGATDDVDTTNAGRMLNVINVAPTIQSAMLNGSDDGSGLTVYEGDSVYASLTSTDPGADGHTFHVDVDYGPNLDGSFDGNTSGTRSSSGADVTQYQDGSYTINFGATDDTETTSTSRTLTVLNVAPTFNSAALNGNDSDTTVYEGDSVFAQASSTDPGADGHGFSVNVDGGPELDGSYDPTTAGTRFSGGTYVTQYQEGTYFINFAVSDDDEIAFVTRTLTVLNAAPTIVDAPGDQVIDFSMSSVMNFSASATDPGIYDVLTYNWDLDGDGEFDDYTGDMGSFDFSMLGLPNGTMLGLGVLVSDGTDSSVQGFNVQLVNVPEPASLGLLGMGATIALRRRKK